MGSRTWSADSSQSASSCAASAGAAGHRARARMAAAASVVPHHRERSRACEQTAPGYPRERRVVISHARNLQCSSSGRRPRSRYNWGGIHPQPVAGAANRRRPTLAASGRGRRAAVVKGGRVTLRLRWALLPAFVLAALGGTPTLLRAQTAPAPAAGAQADLRIWSLIDDIYAGAPSPDTPESFDALVELTRRMGFSVADEHLVVVQQPLAEPRLGLKDQPEPAAGLPADGPGRPPGAAVGRVRPDRVTTWRASV